MGTTSRSPPNKSQQFVRSPSCGIGLNQGFIEVEDIFMIYRKFLEG